MFNESELEELQNRLDYSKTIIERNSDEFEDVEYELGFLDALKAIAFELKKENPLEVIKQYISSHYDYIVSIEKGFIEQDNLQYEYLQKWAEPVAMRISDEVSGLKNNSEDKKSLYNILSKLFLHNPSLIAPIIGTTIIEEDYFKNLD